MATSDIQSEEFVPDCDKEETSPKGEWDGKWKKKIKKHNRMSYPSWIEIQK